MTRRLIQYSVGTLLGLSMLACVAGDGGGRNLSVNENLLLLELTPTESTLLCEDIEFEGARECADGINQRQFDFDVYRCSNEIQLMDRDCRMDARDYFDAYTRSPCRDSEEVLICFYGY